MLLRSAPKILVALLLAVILATVLRCQPPVPMPPALTLPAAELPPEDVVTATVVRATVAVPTPTTVAMDAPTAAPTATVVPETPTPPPTPTPAAQLGLASDLAVSIADLAEAWSVEEGAAIVGGGGGGGDLRLDLEAQPDARLVCERIYVPVQRFATVKDGVTLNELRQAWLGGGGTGKLLLTAATAEDMALLWGAPEVGVEPVPEGQLTEALWQDDQALGVVPFERLEPRLRALKVDGLSAVDNRLEQAAWPLAVRVWLHGSGAAADSLLAYLRENVPQANRDPAKLTVLVMTGVTAMSRSTAWKMEIYQDYSYPAHVVGPELAAADITHISNEVPFVAGCEADPSRGNLLLCSKPEYMAALDEAGVDIVGLTGNHQNDFGFEAALGSLAIYAEHGLPLYGGGSNETEARKPLLLTHHGNRLAFMGANSHGPLHAWATADTPGSAKYDIETLRTDIAALAPEVDVVLVELQYTESYQTEPLTLQKADFEDVSAAGAHIVTGVQAHQPQALAFTDNGLILFGLGNLFFDQMDWWETRQGLIARHTIHDGRHISTELLVTILEDWAQPRWATPEEREELLSTVFAASGW
jgi:poly-gamma-glutamate synthesis protein (capsule biosynthesis protein)